MAARATARPPADLTVELSDPQEMFEGTAADAATGLAPGLAGIDQIRDELRSRPLRAPVSVSVLLPADKITPEAERGLREAVDRYCGAGIRRAEIELVAIRRDGLYTFAFGAVMLGVFLLLSELVLRSSLPYDVRDFFGNGLFLVAAWVGLWYPLDTLVYSGRPFRYERALLRKLRNTRIQVRAEG